MHGARSGQLKRFAIVDWRSGMAVPWRVLHVNAVNQRRVFRLIAMPPIDQPTGGNAVPGGVVLCMDGEVETAPLLRFVAFNVPFVQELAGMLLMDMDALKCARELDLVKALAIKGLAKVTDEEHSTILAERAHTKAAATADVESELLT